jgi:hypothetical protein
LCRLCGGKDWAEAVSSVSWIWIVVLVSIEVSNIN